MIVFFAEVCDWSVSSGPWTAACSEVWLQDNGQGPGWQFYNTRSIKRLNGQTVVVKIFFLWYFLHHYNLITLSMPQNSKRIIWLCLFSFWNSPQKSIWSSTNIVVRGKDQITWTPCSGYISQAPCHSLGWCIVVVLNVLEREFQWGSVGNGWNHVTSFPTSWQTSFCFRF